MDEDERVLVTLLFISSGVIVMDTNQKPGSLQFVRYKEITDSKLYNYRDDVYLKMVLKDTKKSLAFVLKDKNVAQKLVILLRIGKESSHKRKDPDVCTSGTKNLASIIRFGKLRFLIGYDKDGGFASFKQKAIYRLGRYFYPNREISENSIDLSEYSEFLLHANHNGTHILLENDSDFKAAIDFFDKKLDVLITIKKNKERVVPETITIPADKHSRRGIV